MNERLVELDNDDSFGVEEQQRKSGKECGGAPQSGQQRQEQTVVRGQSVRKVLINSLTEVWLRDEANNHPESGVTL